MPSFVKVDRQQCAFGGQAISKKVVVMSSPSMPSNLRTRAIGRVTKSPFDVQHPGLLWAFGSLGCFTCLSASLLFSHHISNIRTARLKVRLAADRGLPGVKCAR